MRNLRTQLTKGEVDMKIENLGVNMEWDSLLDKDSILNEGIRSKDNINTYINAIKSTW